MGELFDLQNEEIKNPKVEQSSKEDQVLEEAGSTRIKDVCGKWSEMKQFIEKNQSNKVVANRAINSLNDTVNPSSRKFCKNDRGNYPYMLSWSAKTKVNRSFEINKLFISSYYLHR